MSEGQLRAIWIKRMRRGPMEPVETAELIAGCGIAGNADQRGKRQVTLIEQEMWEELMHGLDGALPPFSRRANLMVSGIRLANSRGRILWVGSCRIHLHGETKPCERMDEALPGLQQAMRANWAGGAFGEVLDDARITVGERVYWAQQA